MKSFDEKTINRYEVSSEQITIKCYCERRHRKGCGCFDDFVRKAAACFKQSLSSAGMNSQAFADNLVNVATRHYRGIHKWDGRHCEFHRLMVCSCGLCSDPDNLECKVNTNIVEASHNVLVRFRSKDWNIARLYYEVSTNLGLIQLCMTDLYRKRGPDYHSIMDVLMQMGLPVFSGMPTILKMINSKRHNILK